MSCDVIEYDSGFYRFNEGIPKRGKKTPIYSNGGENKLINRPKGLL